MDQFQCFVCGIISKDQAKVSNHMNKKRNYKVTTEMISRKFLCSLCQYFTANMNDLKSHLIKDHNKEQHNWMVEEINSEFTCDECQLQFPRKVMLVCHMDNLHRNDKTNFKENISKEVSVDNQIEEITSSNVIFPCDCNICGELLRDAIAKAI